MTEDSLRLAEASHLKALKALDDEWTLDGVAREMKLILRIEYIVVQANITISLILTITTRKSNGYINFFSF